MARPKPKSGDRDRKPFHIHPKNLKRKRENDDVESLAQRVLELDSRPTEPPTSFADLPLSSPTSSGLKQSKFETLTTIQANAIPAALKGSDILGAAKTGSGKTLAFIVPVLENLYRKRWTEFDGLGALVLSPTRELAIQIFEVLRKVGRHHTFSAGLVIGGKSLREERERLGRMNILVATPGRMLQHMDQTAEFETASLEMLVLDEADRIMDMGFKDTVDAIVEHLPKDRQTMMFSATQTKRISDLARLSLKEPEFVSVHENADTATPATLQQNYVVTPVPEKLDTLWSFLRANLKKKILVFLSSGKQVRFVYEALRHLQPGLPLLHLHGRQKQTARLDITTRFSNSKHSCLFATDIAARGLDFPAVDWVVQVDCPEDAETYIHRVGRTARYEHDGRAVLFLDPSEEVGMLAALEKKRVVLEKINVKPSKMQNSIKTQLQNMCFKDPELKYLGQKAFVSYVRSVHIQSNKDIFKLRDLDLDAFAASLGLPGTPRVKFVKGEDAKKRKNAARALLNISDDSADDAPAEAKAAKPAVRTKYDRMFERRNQDVFAEHYAKIVEHDDGAEPNGPTADADSDAEFLSVSRRFDAGDAALGADSDTSSPLDDGVAEHKARNPQPPHMNGAQLKKLVQLGKNPDEALLVDSRRRAKLLKSKKALLRFKGHGSHLHFSPSNDEDVGHEAEYYEREDEFARRGPAAEQRREFVEREREGMGGVDERDKEAAREKRREKVRRRKERAVMLDQEEMAEGRAAVLVPFESDDVEKPDAEDAPASKRAKKWFEDVSSNDDQRVQDTKHRLKRRKSRVEHLEDQGEPQTLEDLEAIAQGLLARQ